MKNLISIKVCIVVIGFIVGGSSRLHSMDRKIQEAFERIKFYLEDKYWETSTKRQDWTALSRPPHALNFIYSFIVIQDKCNEKNPDQKICQELNKIIIPFVEATETSSRDNNFSRFCGCAIDFAQPLFVDETEKNNTLNRFVEGYQKLMTNTNVPAATKLTIGEEIQKYLIDTSAAQLPNTPAKEDNQKKINLPQPTSPTTPTQPSTPLPIKPKIDSPTKPTPKPTPSFGTSLLLGGGVIVLFAGLFVYLWNNNPDFFNQVPFLSSLRA